MKDKKIMYNIYKYLQKEWLLYDFILFFFFAKYEFHFIGLHVSA